MNKKLTLSIDQGVLELAKNYAHDYGVTLSGMIEDLLREKIKTYKVKHAKISATNKLDGVLKDLAGSLYGLDTNIDYKQEYREHRSRKALKE